MVASENYQMESEIQIEENISNDECLSEVLTSINYKNKEVMCKTAPQDIKGLTNGKIIPEDVMSKEDSETVSEIIYQDAVNLAETKLNNKQNIKVFKPSGTQCPQVHSKVRRVPSTANPKHRTPLLYKSQRSNSSPQIHSNLKQTQRRQSLPQIVPNVAGVHSKPNVNSNCNNSLYQELIRHQLQIQQNAKQAYVNKSPQDHQTMTGQQGLPKSQQQQQQQIIYIQIPNVPVTQNYDAQILQQQISTQLQQLVPQIYTQLVNQTAIQQANDLSSGRSQSPSTLSLNSNSSGETAPPSRNYQQHPGSSTPDNQPYRKRKKTIDSTMANNQTFEVINETSNNVDSQINVTEKSSTFAQDNAALLQKQLENLVLKKSTVIPQITIPLSPELLLQCQQLRDTAYQPRLETIHEESMSVKRLTVSKFSKSKVFASMLTVLSLIVVVVLAGDRTIAVVVVTVIFLIFFLGLVGFLYLNSEKNSNNGFAP